MIASRARLEELNWPLVFVTVGIGLLGIYNLHSAAAAREPNLYLTQLYWLVIAGGIGLLLLIPDYRVTEGLAYPAYAVSCLLLLAVLMQGQSAGGAQRWLLLGPVRFQPSELAKLGTVFCLARYFSTRGLQGDYTLNALLRPLNPSRPLAVIAAIMLLWNDPWLADPVGMLARTIRDGLGSNQPKVGDLLWFRLFLIVVLLSACVWSIFLILRAERQQALLNPWPPKRRKRLITGTVAVFAVLALALAFVWETPFVRDPFGLLIAELYRGAAPGGPYAELTPGLVLRLALALFAAVYLLVALGRLRHGASEPTDVLIAPIDLLALPAVLILVEPDLGTAGIVVLIGMSMILVVGVRGRSLVILGMLGAMISVVAWFGILKDYQKRRILTFLDPENDIQGAGWNAVQSIIAVGSGRWWGKGHMEGTQTQLSFLPEQHTDFAFSVWAEEQGFMGCLLLLALYFGLLALILSVAADARDRYGALLATGVAAIIAWQTLINIGMVVGVFPVVGLTLPLFSYGGSSLMTVVLGVFVVLNVHWRRHAH